MSKNFYYCASCRVGEAVYHTTDGVMQCVRCCADGRYTTSVFLAKLEYVKQDGSTGTMLSTPCTFEDAVRVVNYHRIFGREAWVERCPVDEERARALEVRL